MRRAFLLVVAVALSSTACPDFVPDDRAKILCKTDATCPAQWACRAAVGRCVAPANLEKPAPTMTLLGIDPAVAGAGDAVSIAFSVDVDLDRTPDVTVGDAGAATLVQQQDGGFTFTFTVPDGDESDDGARAVSVHAVSSFGRETTSNIGDVTFLYEVPPQPFLPSIALVERAVNDDDASAVDGSTNTFALSGVAGAAPSATSLRVFTDAALTQQIGADIPVSADGSFAETALTAGTSSDVFVECVNESGRTSAAVEVAVPVFTAISIGAAARNDAPFDVTFNVVATLLANPVVTVGGALATFTSHAGAAYIYSVDLDGSEPAGVNRAVVRVTGSGAGLSPDNSGTDAVAVTLDFTAPVINDSLVVVDEAAPGTADAVSGSAGALSDLAGTDVISPDALIAELLDGSGAVLDAPVVAADGSFAAVDLGDNAHASVTLRVTDEAGNVTTLDLANDVAAPTITGLAVAPTAAKSGAPVTISFHVADASALVSLPSVTVDGRAAAHVSGVVDVTGAGQTFSYAFTPTQGPDAEGALAVVVVVTDTAGNRASAGAALIADYSAPTVTCTEPGGRAVWNALDDAAGLVDDGSGVVGVDVSGVASVELALVRVSDGVFFDGASSFSGTSPRFLPAVLDGAGGWSLSLASAPLVDGTSYAVRVRATDAAGNTSAEIGPFPFIADRTLPTTTITTPPPATTPSLASTASFSCNEAACTFTCAIDGAAAASCTTPFDTGALALGAHTLDVHAVDAAGNVDATGAQASWQITRRFVELDQGRDSDGEIACAISQDTRLWCWGDNHNGPLALLSPDLRVPTPLPVDDPATPEDDSFGWAHVAVGSLHVCATTLAGDLFCFGSNQFDQLGIGNNSTPAPSLVPVDSGGYDGPIAAGEADTCAIRGGALFCWGANFDGEAGATAGTAVSVPTAVPGGPAAWHDVSLAGESSCGIGDDGEAYCFGTQNFSSALGSSGGDTPVPTIVAGRPAGERFVDVAEDGGGGCAVTSAGKLLCWGANFQGEAGQSSTASPVVFPPARVGTDADWLTISKGNAHTCGLRAGGKLVCFGDSPFGERGDGVTTDTGDETLRVIPGVFDGVFLGLSTSWFRTISDGVTRCVGRNDKAQCGVGLEGSHATPVHVANGIVSMSAAQEGQFLEVVDTAGVVHAAGDNASGQLVGNRSVARSASLVTGANSVASVTAGLNFTCTTASGSSLATCFGDDGFGALGGGSGDQTPGPVSLASTGAMSQLSGGTSTACAVMPDARLLCWGFNLATGAQLDVPTNVSGAVLWSSISVGNAHACGIDTSGNGVCFGRPGDGGALGDNNLGNNRQGNSVVSGGRHWSAMAAGDSFTCGIEAVSGALFCWGVNSNGSLGTGDVQPSAVPVAVEGGGTWIDIDAADESACGVKSDGTLLCWGASFFDGPSQPHPTVIASGIVDVDVGHRFACARTSANELLCFGRNDAGQLGNGEGFLVTPVAIPEVP